MKLINLTPHKINIYGENKKLILSVEPENIPARCAQKKKIYGHVEEVPVYCMIFGEIENLPAPKEDTIYIVSRLVATAAGRNDVMCPGEAVRDEEGRVIGCIGLSHV